MARAYLRRQVNDHADSEPSKTVPGFRISELIDQFYAEGVVPEFHPADLGYDGPEEVDVDGWPSVDPQGRIDVDRIDRLEANLVAGIPDSFGEPVVPSPASVPSESSSE